MLIAGLETPSVWSSLKLMNYFTL